MKIRHYLEVALFGAVVNTCMIGLTKVLAAPPVDLSVKQTQAIAEIIQPHKVKLWCESNAPWWLLGDIYDNPPGPADQTFLEHLILTLKEWEHVSSEAIVTSKHGSAMTQTYPALRKALPNMRIIGGLKTWPYIEWPYPLYGTDKGYDWLSDVRIWKELVVDAKAVVKMTGTNHVVIMAEGPMRGFYSGPQYTPDYKAFTDAMAPLRDSGIIFTWYPFGCHGPRALIDGVRLVAEIRKAVPLSRFTSVGDGAPRHENNPDQNRRRNAHRQVCGREPAHHIFATADGRWHYQDGRSFRCYTPSDLQRWLRDRGETEVWNFTGGLSHLAAGTAWKKMLIPETFHAEEWTPITDPPSELHPSVLK